MRHARIPVRHTAWPSATAAAWLMAATCGCAATAGNDAAPVAQLAPHVVMALNDAAQRTGLPSKQLTVVSVEPVTWRDSALGCPEPGMLYTQALVAGYRITIEAAGKSLDYHADQHGRVLLCPPERTVAPLAPPAARPASVN